MTSLGHVEAAAVCAVLAGAAATLLPARIARIPEPEPDPDPTPEQEAAKAARQEAARERAAERGRTYREPVPEPPKEPYVALAARPHLTLLLASLAGSSGAVVGLALGWQWALLVWVPLLPLFAALAFIDWRTRLLPVQLVFPAYAVAVPAAVVAGLASGDHDDLVRAGLGWLVGGLVFGVLWFVYPSGLGYGDVRLSGVLGIALGYLGWSQVLVGLYAGFLLGGVIGVLLRVTKLMPQRHIPLGPFMVLGAVVGVVWVPLVTGGLSGG
jgi:leader peptidase (prepilin peptidase)/N-methyltransferase